MRITSNMVGLNLLKNIEQIENKMNNLQNQIYSSARIDKPSDDPVAVEKILKIKSGLARIGQWKKNTEQAIEFANNADSVMGNIGDMLHRARELALQGANDTLSAIDRQAIKKEIDQIAEQIRVRANEQVAGKPIFAGTLTENDPLPSLDSSWGGNGDLLQTEVGAGINMNYSVDGVQLFQTPIAQRANGQPARGVFETLSNLSQALDQDDSTAVRNTLADLNANLDNVGLSRADLGSRVNRLTALQAQWDTSEANLEQNLSTLQDMDMAKALIDFKNQENVYKAALATGAQIIQMSLVDFIK